MTDRPAEESLAIKNIESILASFKAKFARGDSVVWEPAECESAARDIALVAQKVEDLSAFVYAIDLVGLAAAVVQDSEKGQAVHPRVTQAYCDLTGFTAEELENISWNRIGLIKDFAVLPQKTSERKLFEMVIRTKSGEEIPVEMGLVERSYNSAPAKVMYLLDIRERKQIEKARVEIEEERAEAEEIRASMSVAAQTIGAIAHDIASPMSSLLILQGLTVKEIADKPELFDGAKAAITHLNDILTSLRNFAYGRTDELDYFDAKIVADEAVQFVSARYNLAGVSLDCRLDEGCKVHVQRTDLRRVFGNLLENALEAVSGAGSETGKKFVYLSVEHDSSFVYLTVKDTGVGIAKEDFAKIFLPYSTKNKGRPSGMGLSSVYSFAVHNKGEVSFSSKGMGKGATFTVRLPYVEKPL